MKRLADEAKHSTEIAGVWSSTVQQLSRDIGQNVERVRSATQQMSTHFTEAAGEVELAVKATRRAITAQRLDKAFDKPIAGLETAAQRLEVVLDGLAQAGQRIAAEVSQYNDRVEASAELLTSRLHEGTNSAETVTNGLRQTNRLAEDQMRSDAIGVQGSEPSILNRGAGHNGPHILHPALLTPGTANSSVSATREPLASSAVQADAAAPADGHGDAHLVQSGR